MSDTLDNYPDIASIEKAIKNGEIGENLAKRAQKTGELYIREIKAPGIDYRLYTFDDYTGGYTIIVDKNKLVLLCKGFGGGYAKNLKISNKSGHKMLYFDFEIGSGITQKRHGKYNLGSGRSLVTDNN